MTGWAASELFVHKFITSSAGKQAGFSHLQGSFPGCYCQCQLKAVMEGHLSAEKLRKQK